jgi:hypothetical protein
LSTTREVAVAETKALSTDVCTVAAFKSQRPLRIAKLLQKERLPLGWLETDLKEEDLDALLLHLTSEFVSRRVADADREAHYRTCNLIASAFKEREFHGIAYRTSFWSDGWRKKARSDAEEKFMLQVLYCLIRYRLCPRVLVFFG